MQKPEILVVIPMQHAFVEALRVDYTVYYAPHGLGGGTLDQPGMAQVRAVVTNGSTGLRRAEMERLPALELVCCYGAGQENIDREAAAERRIHLTNAPGVNNETVADHAMALLLCAARGIAALDLAVRAGHWQSSRAPRPSVSGKRLGLVGLGNIGSAIARRAEGFGMRIGYHARSPKQDAPYRYFAALDELAADSDFLVLACPGGPATRHIVNERVLASLGSKGFVVNVARGSVVDTAALVNALESGTIAGAALDVVEGEPEVPPALLPCPNLLLTPHISGRSPESMQAQHDALAASLAAHFTAH